MSSRYVLLASVISKVIASGTSYPHEVLRARIYYKVHDITDDKITRENVIRLAIRMVKTEGPKSLYSGFFANLTRLLPNTAILFYLYETLSYAMGLENQ